MRMKTLRTFVATLLLTAATGCAAVGPIGVVFTSARGPGRLVAAGAADGRPGGSALAGQSCAFSVLGLVAVGDYSVDAALQAAGAEGKTLKNVAVDHSVFSILGLYTKHCTTVRAYVAM